MLSVMVLASWYPNKDDMFNGDFVERHVKASAYYARVFVVFVKKSEELKHDEEQIERSEEGNIVVIRAYYGCKHSIRIIEQWLSNRKYNLLQKKIIESLVAEFGLPSIVHVHMAMKAGVGAIYLKEKYKIPYVLTENWTGYYPQSIPNLRDYNWWYRFKTKQVLKQTDLFLPVTDDLGKLVQSTIANIKYKTVPNVVDLGKFYLDQTNQEHPFRFIHASYLNYQKNPEAMLRAAALLNKRGYKFELFMIGRKAADLEDLARELGIFSLVIFMDAVPYGEVAKLMQRSSALLLFSRFENLPCIVLEALCTGLPVVSSRVGGISEVVNSGNGILVDSLSEGELAKAMEEMINKYTAFDRQAISRRASEQFGLEAVGKSFYEIYLELLPNKKNFEFIP